MGIVSACLYALYLGVRFPIDGFVLESTTKSRSNPKLDGEELQCIVRRERIYEKELLESGPDLCVHWH